MASKAIVSHNGPPPPKKPTEVPPSPSLYIKNLPEKVKKPDMRMALYMLFSTYGTVLDVVDMRTGKMRGQAHVVFKDIQGSTQAMRALQDFDFFGKQLKIQYAKGRSGIFTKLEGAYKPPNAPESAATEAQQSIFTAPSASSTAAPTTTPAAPVPPASTESVPVAAANGPKSGDEGAQGVKRRRDDESDEEEAPMEEESDDDVSMEASSDDD